MYYIIQNICILHLHSNQISIQQGFNMHQCALVRSIEFIIGQNRTTQCNHPKKRHVTSIILLRKIIRDLVAKHYAISI